MTHNTREGIEEAVDDYLAITKVHPSIDKRKQLIGAFHQELQKAREEERERILLAIARIGKIDFRLSDVLDAINQSELDQPTVCKVCHGHGNNGADDTLCLNCGGTGKEETAEKTTAKYTLKDFCIEFRDEVNNNPEMLSALRQLTTNPS